MKEGQLEIADFCLEYKIMGDKVSITGFRGLVFRIEVPSRIEGRAVTEIGKKAFLSRKNLYHITLPDTIEEIGDWAFAHCEGLSVISLPRKEIRFGKAVFKECTGLKQIGIRELGRNNADGEPEPADIPELMAAAVTGLDAYYLLELPEAGSREWLAMWDARLLSVLHASDQEGYLRQEVCGEEDYGGVELADYASAKRRTKVRLAFLRLLHPQGLSSSLREELEEFLRSLTKGRAGEETWHVIREEHQNDREYYRLFAELSCINEENFDEILADIKEDCPEMKAFFLKKKEEERKTADFFAGLEL